MPTSLFTQDHLKVPYEWYSQTIRYVYDAGILQIPIAKAFTAGQKPAASIVQVVAPFGAKILKFSSSRIGLLPNVPSPVSPNPANEILSRMIVDVETPVLLPDGVNHITKAEGTYIYVLKQPIVAGSDSLRMGGTPIDATSADSNLFSPGQFVSGLQ